jgi:NAD(P) transhydrogenase
MAFLIKLLFRQDDLKLIGVHIMGDLATEVVHIGLVAMMCNASANLFDDACLNMPTLGVLYKTATLNALQNIPLSPSSGGISLATAGGALAVPAGCVRGP